MSEMMHVVVGPELQGKAEGQENRDAPTTCEAAVRGVSGILIFSGMLSLIGCSSVSYFTLYIFTFRKD